MLLPTNGGESPVSRDEPESASVANAHVNEYLEYYCGLDKPNYALLIKGGWGSGKTFLVDKFITSWEQENTFRKYLYVSVYGMTDFSQIEDEIFRQLHPFLSSKGAKFLAAATKSALKLALKFNLNESDSIGVKAEIPTLDIFKSISVGNAILVFDDIERCSMDINDLLGYINHFVEHDGVKVILVANEDELKRDETKESDKYHKIKEKLVGRTLEIEPDVDAALSFFVGKVLSEEARIFIESRANVVKDIYEESKSQNLRFIRQTLMDFERIYEKIEVRFRQCEPLMDKFLRQFLAASFEVKLGTVKGADVEALFKYDLVLFGAQKKEAEKPSPSRIVMAKYPSAQFHIPFLMPTTWRDLIDRGVINIEDLHAQFDKCGVLPGMKKENWRSLWGMHILTQGEFDSLLFAVKTEFESDVYNNVGVVFHVFGILLHLAKAGLLEWSVSELVDKARASVDRLCASGAFDVGKPNLFERLEGSHGLAAYEEGSAEYKELREYLRRKSVETFKAKIPEITKEMMSLMQRNPDDFLHEVCYTASGSSRYWDVPIFESADAEEFTVKLLAVSPQDQFTIATALRMRYAGGAINKLIGEMNWLRAVREHLVNAAGAGSFDQFRVKNLVKLNIDPILEMDEEAKERQKQRGGLAALPVETAAAVE
jgi:predicted secreted Zn-dependent protease